MRHLVWVAGCAVTLVTLVGSTASSAQPLVDSPAAGQRLPAASRWEPARRLTRSAGESLTSINFARSIAADARGGVHVVWREQATDGPAVYYKRSPDGGVSWGPAVRLGPCPGPDESGNPSIAVSGDAVHVVWWDERAAPQAPPQVWYKRSPDGGLTWESERAIANSPAPAAFPSIAVWGKVVHVVYVDQRDGSAEVYYLRSRDAGQTWSAADRLSATPRNSYTPTVAVFRANVYVAWTDTRHSQSDSGLEEEYFRRSADGGSTWEPEQRMTIDPPRRPANSWAPSLAAAGSHVWMTWFDDRGKPPHDFDIYVDHSADFGATWTGNRRLTQALPQALRTSMRPVIASYGTDLYIAWWSTGDGSDRVHVLRSPDLGATWGTDTVLATSSALLRPSLAAASSGVHVVWTDARDGNAEIYYRRIAGVPVPVRNGRIAFAQGAPGARQIVTTNPDGSDPHQLTSAGDNIYPAWSKDGTRLAFSSNRTGAYEIWSMAPNGADPRQISHGAPHSSYVPDWSFDGTRIAYAYVSTEVGSPEVWVMSSEGTDARRLTTTPPAPSGPTWSLLPTWEPGDQRIYYASTAGGDSQIWGMFADGRGQEQKTHGLTPQSPQANAPQFNRQGVLAFWSGVETQFGEVWKVEIGSPVGPVQLTETPDPQSSDNPAWSPDGSRIAFDSSRGYGVAIWIMNADGSDAQRVLPDVSGRVAWQPLFR